MRAKSDFYAPAESTLIGLDTPPHTQEHDTIAPVVEMSIPCRQYLQEHGEQIVKLEFLVSKNGKTSQFYPLKSAGVCDQDVARTIQESTIAPAQKNGKPKAVLVHFRIALNGQK
ncbi:MAG: energy transducer TonB [Fodinibius sp.]|nr:energy transducer TonB [Fodinibius sp.]